MTSKDGRAKTETASSILDEDLTDAIVLSGCTSADQSKAQFNQDTSHAKCYSEEFGRPNRPSEPFLFEARDKLLLTTRGLLRKTEFPPYSNLIASVSLPPFESTQQLNGAIHADLHSATRSTTRPSHHLTTLDDPAILKAAVETVSLPRRFVCRNCYCQQLITSSNTSPIRDETLTPHSQPGGPQFASPDNITDTAVHQDAKFKPEAVATPFCFQTVNARTRGRGNSCGYVSIGSSCSGNFPKVLHEDKADPELDCISLPIAADDSSSGSTTVGVSHSRRLTVVGETVVAEAGGCKSRSEHILKVVELLVTFVAVVSLWGSVDNVVTIITGADVKWGIVVYISLFGGAVVLQLLCNKLLRTSMSMSRAIEIL